MYVCVYYITLYYNPHYYEFPLSYGFHNSKTVFEVVTFHPEVGQLS